MASQDDVKKNFQENLKALEYHGEVMRLFNAWKIYYEITCSFISDVLKSRKKLLEIGSGPTVHNIANASAYFPTIVQSDFVENNVENLKRWHKQLSPLDWTGMLNIAAALEDFRNVQNMLRVKSFQRR
ncbi:uncharacterized protein CEXT_81501 [Caerostris extrusa]|uniref:Uncharacterized protein n=1 Tax=Caerostris extrusa TaxID=172846 RepID=A0AAV4MUD8_CAEEX|nr:uncharacterized protein CEXT_81501 [Caerostris extrusa]